MRAAGGAGSRRGPEGNCMKIDCFKAYDVRGRVPDQLNPEVVYAIGRAFAEEVRPGRTVVGHDIRLSSPTLAQALIEGLTPAVATWPISVCAGPKRSTLRLRTTGLVAG